MFWQKDIWSMLWGVYEGVCLKIYEIVATYLAWNQPNFFQVPLPWQLILLLAHNPAFQTVVLNEHNAIAYFLMDTANQLSKKKSEYFIHVL